MPLDLYIMGTIVTVGFSFAFKQTGVFSSSPTEWEKNQIYPFLWHSSLTQFFLSSLPCPPRPFLVQSTQQESPRKPTPALQEYKLAAEGHDTKALSHCPQACFLPGPDVPNSCWSAEQWRGTHYQPEWKNNTATYRETQNELRWSHLFRPALVSSAPQSSDLTSYCQPVPCESLRSTSNPYNWTLCSSEPIPMSVSTFLKQGLNSAAQTGLLLTVGPAGFETQ